MLIPYSFIVNETKKKQETKQSHIVGMFVILLAFFFTTFNLHKSNKYRNGHGFLLAANSYK